MHMKLLNYFLLLLMSLLLFFVTAWIGSFSHSMRFAIGGIVYAISVWIMSIAMKRNRVTNLTVFIFLFSPVAVLSVVILVKKNFGELAIPSTLNLVLGCIVGYYIARITLRSSILVLLTYSAFSVFAAGPIYAKWLLKENYGSFSPQVREEVPAFQLRAQNGYLIDTGTIKNKIVVFDFWNTACAACYQKFPRLEQFYQKMKENQRVAIFSVNIPLKNGHTNPDKNKLRYSFEQLSAENDSMARIFNVGHYPTVIVIHDGHIVLRGDLESAEKLVSDLLAD